MPASASDSINLAADYSRRAEIRLKALAVLFDGESWADVVRESQEIVLRACGVDAPGIHDVSEVLLAERTRLADALQSQVEDVARVSRTLRRDRELAFCGAEDLTPSTFYSKHDAEAARDGARLVVTAVKHLRRQSPDT